MNERTRTHGLQAVRILLLAGAFAFSSPLLVNDGKGQAREFVATSLAPAAAEPSLSQQDLFRETFELFSGAPVEKQSLPSSGGTEQSEEPAITVEPGVPAQPYAPEVRRLNEIDQYLWSVYQRSGTKRDSSGDFTWKDAAAATRLGLLPEEYVVGGMDPDFRELLFDLGHAMDAAGINWTILSAFRDDYRQHLASGFKAHGGNSFHGGSIATGGYGHGCAADLAASDSNASSDAVWRWLDQYGARFGVHRPMRQSDPAHIQPLGGWHEIAAELRDKRAEIRHAYLPSGTADVGADESVSPVLASHSGVSEAQFECERSHSGEHFRTARLERFRMARLERSRIARLERVRTAELERSKPTETEPSKTAETERSRTAEPERPRTEPEHSRTARLGHSKMVWLANHQKPRVGHVLTLDTDRPHRGAKWRTLVDIRSHPSGEFSRRHARSRARLHLAGQAATGRS
jgi:hypothetical protein